MEASDCVNTNTSFPLSSSPSSSPPNSLLPLAPQPPTVVLSPCAACKILRRRCVDKCVLAPYFPPTDPLKFTTAHRVFGASNIIKLLQELPENQRGDAVSSMVYEAYARIRDPVYGSAGAIFQIQKEVSDLQAQLAMAQAEILYMQTQNSNLITIICMEMPQSQQLIPQAFDDFESSPEILESNSCFLDESSQGSIWEPLWI